MSTVELKIAGRNYRVACAAGEEEHITGLGLMIDAKIADMNLAGQSEGRTLLFATLLLADELHEIKHRGGSATPPPAPAPAPAAQNDDAFAARLEAIAAALEKCAVHLEA